MFFPCGQRFVWSIVFGGLARFVMWPLSYQAVGPAHSPEIVGSLSSHEIMTREGAANGAAGMAWALFDRVQMDCHGHPELY